MTEEQLASAINAKEQELKMKAALRVILDSSAFERLALMKVSNENLYAQVVSYIFTLYNAGKIRERINEEKLKQMASLFLTQRRETKIIRK